MILAGIYVTAGAIRFGISSGNKPGAGFIFR